MSLSQLTVDRNIIGFWEDIDWTFSRGKEKLSYDYVPTNFLCWDLFR